ncbi:nitrite/sulfite reductase [Govanella unica]|uniref:Nitrite/sulfite reductase n=1 Tax=Govanella unica TaxID=2975056 RepID=A0A9X3Z6P4_9PROT|nr:nitrite/sulfite reductase [Govania unica]MDA5193144.1 nitrite/sulfite reductase [Govania unica]
MYHYTDIDRTIVQERAAQFRDQVRRRLIGELTEEEFRPLRLMNGLYLQLHAYMLRVAVPYGLLASKQLRALAEIAEKYDRGYGHWTTRQNLQYNWIRLDDVPEILDLLASVDMHAIQTSGNCIRNISADHFAGAIADEIEDPRPYAEIMRQWSSFHPEFSYLPRKFKIAFSGAVQDRAAVAFHDLGFRIVKNDQGEIGFRAYVGGGMGRTPMIGKVTREFLPKEHLLTYTEAVMRVYNEYGRRDNIYKARIKILVHELGVEEFSRLVDAEWEHTRQSALVLTEAEIARVAASFSPLDYDKVTEPVAAFEDKRASDKAFANWVERNTLAHKVAGYRIVNLSLKKPSIAPGDATDSQMRVIADLADHYSFGQIRATHEQNLVLADVRQSDLFALWKALELHGLATPNIATLQDIICCPGLDYCSLANARSIPISDAISEHFDRLDYLYDLGELKIKISGCINACGHHHVGHIGILGVDKKGEEYYQITLGGSASDDAAIGQIIGAAFSKDTVVAAIERVLNVYIDLRHEDERFLDTYRRVGIKPFKERVYANN